MNTEITKKIEELKQLFSNYTTMVTIEITAYGVKFTTEQSTPQQLKDMNNYTEKQKEQVCDIVYRWMLEHDCHSGEHAGQNDACNIDAIELVCDLADIVGVENEYS